MTATVSPKRLVTDCRETGTAMSALRRGAFAHAHGSAPAGSGSTARLRAAESAVLEYAGSERRAAGAFVGGSLALGGSDRYSDVDLRVFLEEGPLPPPRFEMRMGVPLEWKFLLWEGFESADRCFDRPFFLEEIARGLILYDRAGGLARLAEAARGLLRGERDVRRRASRLFSAAESAAFSGGLPPFWAVRQGVFLGCQAAALLAGVSPAHRRVLGALRSVDPELYEGAARVLGCWGWGRGELLESSEAALSAVSRCPAGLLDGYPYLSPARLDLWRGYFQERSEARPRGAGLPLWTLIAQLSLVDVSAPEARALRERAASYFEGAGPGQAERLALWLESVRSRFGLP